ncbi:MAG: RNA-binding S4 domain-containing protein [Burkholderiaceae bacterium]
MSDPQTPGAGVRIDKWLWAARFFKTRSLAQQAIDAGHVQVHGQRVKLSRPVRVGDQIRLRAGDDELEIRVLALFEQRGPASVAQQLYQESAESQQRRAARQQARRLTADPALAIDSGRPTKRDRRKLDRFTGG